jgi:hypothetical protein
MASQLGSAGSLGFLDLPAARIIRGVSSPYSYCFAPDQGEHLDRKIPKITLPVTRAA